MTDKKTMLCLGMVMGVIIFIAFAYDYLEALLPWRLIAMYGVGGLAIAFILSFIIMIRRENKQAKVNRMAEQWEREHKE